MSEQDKDKARKRGDPIDWCRNVVNRRIARVKTMWRWAESRKLVPAGSYHHLQTVRGLPKTAKCVRQTPKVRPAFGEQLQSALGHCRATRFCALPVDRSSIRRSCQASLASAVL